MCYFSSTRDLAFFSESSLDSPRRNYYISVVVTTKKSSIGAGPLEEPCHLRFGDDDYDRGKGMVTVTMMKKMALVSIGIALLAVACAPAAGLPPASEQSKIRETSATNVAQQGYRVLTVDEAKARLAANPKAKLVDVRSEAEYRAGHIERAVVIPLEEVKTRAASELGKDEEIIFYCHTGPMGAQAASTLVEMGYGNVSNLRGGIAGWQAEGNPLVQ